MQTTTRQTWTRRVAAGALAGAIAASMLPGIAGAASRVSALPDVAINGQSWTISAPARIPAGFVRVTLQSQAGPQGATAMVGRLGAGVDKATVIAMLKKGDEGGILSRVTLLGGPAGAGKSDAVLKLSAATYVVFNIDQGPNGKPIAKYGFFSVAPSAAPVAEPTANATVRELDYKFKLPATLPSGQVVLKLVNAGPSAHEFALARVHAGKTYQDLLTYIKQQNPSGPPPADFVGGAAVMSPKQAQWVPLNLTPGLYVAMCFMPDKHGMPHIMDGMITKFTVR